jgi:hypothetical protein
MPSSTSSSDAGGWWERPLPQSRIGAALALAAILFLLAMFAWESYWRAYGAVPGIRNSEGLWAAQRRRIDHGEGDRTVIIGSSRVLFDLQLPVWEAVTGRRPIQLALEGTSPMEALEGLAEDADFTGRLVVGVTPGLFFSGFAYRRAAFERYRKETPTQWLGQQLSQRLLEPWLAYYDDDFALFTVLERQPWPVRPGMDPPRRDVRKLSVADGERNTRMWAKVETDEAYAALARSIWAQGFDRPPPGGPEEAAKRRDEQIERAVKAVEKLRARGVPKCCSRGCRAPAGLLAVRRTRSLPRASDLGFAARPPACAWHPFRGPCAAARLPSARVVAPLGQRGGSLHRRASRRWPRRRSPPRPDRE